jgi:hypothetical protein
LTYLFPGSLTKSDRLGRFFSAAIADDLCLSGHTSKWNVVYLAADKEISGADNITLSGKFFSKVYEGPFKNTGKWCQDFAALAKSRNMDIKKWYMWYRTWPK